MTYQIWLYIFCLLIDVALILLQLFLIIQYTDLESDYINPMDFTRTVERLAPIEPVIQAAITTIFLLSGEWISFILTLPLSVWNFLQYQKTKFQYDATTIFRTVGNYKVESFVKLGVYFVLFCYYLYSMIWSMIVHSDATDVFFKD